MRLAALPVAVTSALLLSLTVPAFSQIDAQPGSRDVTFQDVSSQDAETSNEFCLRRYGSGYTVTPSKDSPKRKYISDKGHTITLLDRSEIIGQGVFAEHDRFLMSFPDAPDKKVEVTQFVTGMIGADGYSGVFTDGTCTGKVTVGPWKTG